MAASISQDKAVKNFHALKPENRLWIWRALALILAFYVLTQTGERLLWFSKLQPGAGTFAFGVVPAPQFAPRYLAVTRASPDGPMAKAGVRTGDHIKFDRGPGYMRANMAGDVANIVVDHQGVKTRLSVKAIPVTDRAFGPSEYLRLLIALPYFISALFGAFIIYRGRENASLIMLGVALVAQSLTSHSLGMWSSRLLNWEVFAVFGQMVIGLSSMAFMAFALLFYQEFVGPVQKWVWRLTAIYAALIVVVVSIRQYLLLTITSLPLIGDGANLFMIVNLCGWIAALICLSHGWRLCGSEIRQRYTLLIVALFALVATRVAAFLHLYLVRGPDSANIIWDGALICLGTAVAAPLFAYAILRHKVFDIGFAINRTLIFGIISFGLLLVFGLIEWGSEKLLPHESLEASAAVNAGVALTIFVVFHQIRDFVEHNVERLLFRSWHDNEAKLRKFVKEAAFIGKPEVLASAGVAAVARFAGQAECALYLRAGQDFKRADGGLANIGEQIDSDEPMVVTLRSDPAPLEPGDKDVALALPLTHRGELDGFMLLAAKPAGDSYRPDEIELLHWAARQIGLDLHALKIATLEQNIIRLETQVGELQHLLSHQLAYAEGGKAR